ncbi:hypothetical protein Pse7429DRAFT_3794, partial [Pseudanabaena biceps PCC 7429]
MSSKVLYRTERAKYLSIITALCAQTQTKEIFESVASQR